MNTLFIANRQFIVKSNYIFFSVLLLISLFLDPLDNGVLFNGV